jgi:hypothetical protein
MRRTFLSFASILSLFVSIGFFSVPHGAQVSRARIVAGYASASLEEDKTLVAAFPVNNEGGAEAGNVVVTGVSLQEGSLISTRLPLELGSIRPGEHGTVFAAFGKGSFVPGKTYLMKVEGSFLQGREQVKFGIERQLRIPPASPGEGKAATSSSPPRTVKGAPYPPRPPHFDREVNEGTIWTVPVGVNRRPEPRSKESSAERAPEGRQHHRVATPLPVNFFTNAALGINSSSVNEPSGGVGKDVVFVTANWFAAYSTNNGGSFTQLNPSTIFPNADGGFCCDQIVQYVPSIDRVIWLMQYSRAAAGPNRYRVAAASPAAVKNSHGTAWTYWDITSTQLGYGNNWVDYPDLSVGNNSLYLSFDEVGVGRTVVRMPLSEIQASATIHFWYTDPNNSPMGYGGHLTQNAQDEIFWAGHNSNSNMRVFSWQEASNTYFWRDIGIGTWPNNNTNLTSTSPDGQDWLTKLRNFPSTAVLGSTRVLSSSGRKVNQIWFAWSAPAGSNFRQPHVQWVALNRDNNFSLITQQQIWNSSYAFSYPALATNSNGEVGLSLEYGGGGNYENHVAGFWGDFIVYITTSSNTGSTRFGDCVTIRQDANHPERFDAFGYGMVNSGGIRSDTHYVVFGR